MSQLTTADLYDRCAIAAERYEPAALVTIVNGPGAGRKLAIVGSEQTGTLGNERLDQMPSTMPTR